MKSYGRNTSDSPQNRGDIILVSFLAEEGRQLQVKRRPAVIVSSDTIKNEVCVVPLTRNILGSTFLNQIVVKMDSADGKRGGLRCDSVIDCSIVARIPTALVVSKIGEFSQEMMAQVDQCISDQGQEP